MPHDIQKVDCVVAGGGPVGLAAALALNGKGFAVAMAGVAIEREAIPLDPRTLALFQPSIGFLHTLGLPSFEASLAAPLRAIRLIDDTGRLVRAPEIIFEARDIGLDTFGYNIPHAALTTALLERLKAAIGPGRLSPAEVTDVKPGSDALWVVLGDGASLPARLLVGADGRRSACRRLAWLPVREWAYPQAALVVSIAHSRAHHDVSTELHRLPGPLTTVPLPGQASSIVWVESPPEAERLHGLPDSLFAQELRGRLQGFLGRIEGLGPRRVFPLGGLLAEPAGRDRVALAGEALHAFPPIGAQGLNLGLRDVASLAGAITDGDPGSEATLSAYAKDRRRDVAASVLMVDMLDRSLFSGLLPLQLARGAGLHLANIFPGLKRAMMHRGMGPG